MPSVCFTGRGYNRAGTFVERSLWTRNATVAGFTVVDDVTPTTTYLVASRTDTTKATTARHLRVMGYDVQTLSYREWLDVLLRHNAAAVGATQPEYSIGFYRRQFTAMQGDTCLARCDTFDHARAAIRRFALERGIRDPQIEVTTEAARERDRVPGQSRLASDMRTLAGYASPRTALGTPPRDFGWDEEEQCFRETMGGDRTDNEFYQLWYERRFEFPRFTDRVRARRADASAGIVAPPPPPHPEPTHAVTPISAPRRVINWED